MENKDFKVGEEVLTSAFESNGKNGYLPWEESPNPWYVFNQGMDKYVGKKAIVFSIEPVIAKNVFGISMGGDPIDMGVEIEFEDGTRLNWDPEALTKENAGL